MRCVVTGNVGQVVTSLIEAGPRHGVEIIALGRPGLDLAESAGIALAIRNARPDVVVNAAAYTAVDKAESEPDLAMAVNGTGAGAVAAAAKAVGAPVIHLSTDYVFAGDKPTPYIETDPTDPQGAYGRTKLAGEHLVASSQARHVILRTSWVYAPQGANFVRTMLRLAETRDTLGVVGDQHGCPTYAPDIADAVLRIASRITAEPDNAGLNGIFHLCGGGETTWAGFAEAIFAGAARRGGKAAAVKPITTADYPTPARRPANSRMDCAKLAGTYGIALPDWHDALERCLDRVIVSGRA
jgi:dTDP-4-dehydrorhamnose reductase